MATLRLCRCPPMVVSSARQSVDRMDAGPHGSAEIVGAPDDLKSAKMAEVATRHGLLLHCPPGTRRLPAGRRRSQGWRGRAGRRRGPPGQRRNTRLSPARDPGSSGLMPLFRSARAAVAGAFASREGRERNTPLSSARDRIIGSQALVPQWKSGCGRRFRLASEGRDPSGLRAQSKEFCPPAHAA
jgi:hypothetical protein